MPNWTTETTVPCPSHLTVLPYCPYILTKRQFGINHRPHIKFYVQRQQGVLLRPPFGAPQQLDDEHTTLLDDCGTKVMYVVHLQGYQPFKQQKYASQKRRHGGRTPNDRAKVVKQLSEVMEAFLSKITNEEHNPFFFSPGGIELGELYLLELRQVSQASFQPIFAVRKERAIWNISEPFERPPSTATKDQYEEKYRADMNVLPEQSLMPALPWRGFSGR